MTLKREDIQGWAGSILLHVLLAIIFLIWHVENITTEPEFIELTWGAITTVVKPAVPQPATSSSSGAAVTQTNPSSRTLDLPERRFLAENEDLLALNPQRKLEAEDHTPNTRTNISEGGDGEKERGFGAGVGEKRDRSLNPNSGGEAMNVGGPGIAGSSGSDISNAVSYSMTWSDGGTRKKISGNLPNYPEGANVEAQIKIEAVVQPDGGVKIVKPTQKGNTRLEEAAMKEVRLWKFERLRASDPQREQTCLITFNFKLR